MSLKLASDLLDSTHVEVTPVTAGWRYLGFSVHTRKAGEFLEGRTRDEELILVVLGGNGELRVGGLAQAFEGRRDVFDGLPHFAYVPRHTAYRVTAWTELEVACGSAPAQLDFEPRICTPADVQVEMRGGHNVTRQISHLVDPGFGCQRLLAVEVYTPSGNWSSYPPHRHDEDDPPRQVRLEEIYYYRMAPDGFAIQRLYDEEHDDCVLVRDRDTVLVKRGYHPVVAGPGYDVYYLNILAGDTPSWAAADDPHLAWVRGTWNSRQPLRLPMTP